MSTTYRRTNTNSGLSGGADWNKAILDPASDAAGESSFSVANLGTEDSYGYTGTGDPGAGGVTGNYTAELEITTGATSYEVSVAVARVNSSGTQQAISSFTAEQQATAGTKTFNLSSVNLGAWASGDRLRVVYRFRSTREHGGADTITVSHGGANNEVVAPWTEADTTAPVLSSQTVISITHEGGTPRVTTDEGNGTLYMVLVPNGDSPSAAQIKAGQNSSGGAALADESIAISSIGVKTFSAVTGLEPETDYDVWFVHTDAASNDSTPVKADFATTAAPVFTPVVNAFRFYEDGSESGSTPLAAENVSLSGGPAVYEVTILNSQDTLSPNQGESTDWGEAFVGDGNQLTSVSAWLWADPGNFPTGPITAVLYAADRTPGEYAPNGAVRIGSELAESSNSVLAENLTETPTEHTFTFTGAPELSGNFVAQIRWLDPDFTFSYVTIGEWGGVKLDSNLAQDTVATQDDFHLVGSIITGGGGGGSDLVVSSDVQLHLRYRIQESGGGAGLATDDYGVEKRKNTGSWVAITASSSDVQADTGSSLTDGAATTNRATNGISDGTGSFVAGEQEEGNGVIEDHQLTANNFVEHLWALKLIYADLADADLLEFRVTLNGTPISSTVTPSITVSKPPITGADISVPTALADVVAYALAVAAGASAVAPTASAEAAAFAPQVATGAAVAVQLASSAVTAFAPVILTGVAVYVPSALTDAAAFAPLVAGGVAVEAPPAVTAVAAFAPSAFSPAVVEAPSVLSAVSAFTPTITAGSAVVVPTALSAVAAFAPAVAAGAAVFPSTAPSAVAAFAPAVAVGASVFILTAPSSVAAFVPEIAAGAAVTTPLATTAAVAFAPVVIASEPGIVTPPVALVSVLAFAPSVAAGARVEVPFAVSSMEAFVPTGGAATVVFSPLALSVVAASAPQVSSGAGVAVFAALTGVLAFAPSAAAGVSVEVPLAASSVRAYAPTGGAATAVSVPTTSTDVEAYAPGVVGGAAVMVPVSDTLAVAHAPELVNGAFVYVPLVGAWVLGFPPSIVTPGVPRDPRRKVQFDRDLSGSALEFDLPAPISDDALDY